MHYVMEYHEHSCFIAFSAPISTLQLNCSDIEKQQPLNTGSVKYQTILQRFFYTNEGLAKLQEVISSLKMHAFVLTRGNNDKNCQ